MMKAKVRTAVAAAMLLAPAAATFLALPAAAAEQAALQVRGLSLNADEGLQPGSELRISVQATPGGRATLNFGKTKINVPLRETDRGVYTATYTVRRADRIDPTSVITVSLTRNDATTRHSFAYPPSFQALAMGNAPAPEAARPAPVAAVPRIERFSTLPVERLEAGRELRYRVTGLPGANVTLEVPGVVTGLAMRETSPGVYEAQYTVRQRDNLDAFDVAVATLRSGNRWVTSRLAHAYVRDGDRDHAVVRDRDRDREDRDSRDSRDNRPPSITALLPRNGDVVSAIGMTTIGADFADDSGRGVDPDSVRVIVGGRDVTPFAAISPQRFTYRADLPPGHYEAQVSARDRSGNAVNRSWSFDVGGPREMGGPPEYAPDEEREGRWRR